VFRLTDFEMLGNISVNLAQLLVISIGGLSMKFLISLFVVFMMIGFVAAPAMACDHDCGNCTHTDTCNGHDDGEAGCPDGDDCGDDHGDNGDDQGGCSDGSCHI
jgi:hypothetical protein